jgi:O-antigen/teichoic acid export membrane protein
LTVFVLGGAVIETAFRPEYLMAVGAVQALSLRACAMVGQSMIEPTFSATKRTSIAFYNNLILTAAMVATILGFAPFGVISVAWAQAVLQILSVPMSLWIIGRWSPIDIDAGVRAGIKATIVLACYCVALWAAWQLLSDTNLTETLRLCFGIGAALVLGLIAASVSLLLGILKLEVFSD